MIKRRVEMELNGVTIEEGAVRFRDSDNLNVAAIQRVREKSVGVAVYEAGDCDAQGRLSVRGGEIGSKKQEQERE